MAVPVAKHGRKLTIFQSPYTTTMYSLTKSFVREKRFRTVHDSPRKRGGYQDPSTITDDHTLFLLHQDREKRSKVERKSFAFWKFWR